MMSRLAVLTFLVLPVTAIGPVTAAEPVVSTTFQAETAGSPVTAIEGKWRTDGLASDLVFGGGHVLGSTSRMRATWTARLNDRTDSVSLGLSCRRIAGSLDDSRNRWTIKVAMIPKSGAGKVRRFYNFQIPGVELLSGEELSFNVAGFQPEKWKLRVVLRAKLVSLAEYSGHCLVEAS